VGATGAKFHRCPSSSHMKSLIGSPPCKRDTRLGPYAAGYHKPSVYSVFGAESALPDFWA